MPRIKGKRKGAWPRKSLKGCPWYWTAPDGKDYSLRDKQGELIKGLGNRAAAQSAYRLAAEDWKRGQAANPEQPARRTKGAEPTIATLCDAYLKEAEERNLNRPKSLNKKAEFFFQFCTGYAGSNRSKERGEWEGRLGKAYGHLTPSELTEEVIEDWIDSKEGKWKMDWIKGVRVCTTANMYLQWLATAFNWAKGKRPNHPCHIAANPLKAVKIPKAKVRERGFSPEEKEALLNHATPLARFVFDYLLATGSRDVCEFADVVADEVRDFGDTIEIHIDLTVKGKGTKSNRTLRRVFVPTRFNDTIRQLCKQYPEGPIFRNSWGLPWTNQRLSEMLAETIGRVEEIENPKRIKAGKKPLDFSWGPVIHSLRHTYAQEGIATGEITCDTLAAAMGNTEAVCRKTYAKHWDEIHSLPQRSLNVLLAR